MIHDCCVQLTAASQGLNHFFQVAMLEFIGIT